MHRKQAQACKTIRRSFKILIELLDMYCLTSNKGPKEEQNYVYNTLFTIVHSIKNTSFKGDFPNECEAVESRYKLFQNENDTQAITFDLNNSEFEILDLLDMR